MYRDTLETAINEVLKARGVAAPHVILASPVEPTHGDYTTNAALAYAKELGVVPRALAEAIVAAIRPLEDVAHVDIAGPGFVNITLTNSALGTIVREVLHGKEQWGGNTSLTGKHIMVEHTQPNPFKPFHIGHLMSNMIGESIARLLNASGARIVRANYQGDVGPHIAKAIWGIRALGCDPHDVNAIGRAYARGAKAYKDDPAAKEEMDRINKAVYDHSDQSVNDIYAIGRAASLERFEELYRILGSSFDRYYFESESAPVGMSLVREHVGSIFAESEGAIVFHGEEHGLHTRVFITSLGLPTYDAKELGLMNLKFTEYPDLDLSITTTATEQDEYFKVVFAAAGLLWPERAHKLKHISHGMMMLPTGKMSSRTGDVVTGESLLEKLIEAAHIRAAESRADDSMQLAQHIAVAAIKYQVLKQAAGKNIVFEESRALSIEGDSGPYVQYAYARARSILAAAHEAGVTPRPGAPETDEERLVARLLMQFPDVVARAQAEYAPHHVAQYVGELAASYNRWYAKERVVGDPAAARRAALTEAVAITLKNGLHLLGIQAPERM